MLIKLMGLADMLAVLALYASTFLPGYIIIIMAIYLMIKGLIFAVMGNIVSLIDMLIGFYMILIIFGISYWIITLLFAAHLLQKSIVSVFS